MRRIRIGEGAGYAGAWIEPAVELVERGEIQYLCVEALAERTIALAQLEYSRDSTLGFTPLLERRIRAVLGPALARDVRIVTNMGAANPRGAALRVLEIAKSLGLRAPRIFVVEGDDVRLLIRDRDYAFTETRTSIREVADHIVSANAYLGAEPIARALDQGADMVITGRVGDAALALGCIVHEYGWMMDDWERLGAGTLVGHLLECSSQVTGGYFADPGYKEVRNLGRVGYPIADVGEDGTCIVTKVAGSGGIVSEQTCKEQVLYEIHDPRTYLTPDVVADFSQVTCRQVGRDRVEVGGARGRPRPETLKVSVGLKDGYIADGQISYGGPGALERAKMAADIIRERFDATGMVPRELRVDYIGVNSLFGEAARQDANPPEVRLRIAARTASAAEAQQIVDDVEALWIVGPAGGGGATKQVRPVVKILSTLVPRDEILPHVRVTEVCA